MIVLKEVGSRPVGVILHMAVGSTKRSKSQTGLPPVLAVRNLLLVIDAHMGDVLMKLLLALIGFFALLFTAGLDNLTPFNTFLVGNNLPILFPYPFSLVFLHTNPFRYAPSGKCTETG